MAKGQVSIGIVGEMTQVVVEARKTFPDAENDSQALRRALFHWYHDRQDNSKRGALRRLEERMSAVENELAEVKSMLHQLLGRNNAPD